MNTKAKPSIKWLGGKGQLIEQLEAKLPTDFDNWDNATYFVKQEGMPLLVAYIVSSIQNLWQQRHQKNLSEESYSTNQKEKASILQTAIGLQTVYGLQTSDYLKATP